MTTLRPYRPDHRLTPVLDYTTSRSVHATVPSAAIRCLYERHSLRLVGYRPQTLHDSLVTGALQVVSKFGHDEVGLAGGSSGIVLGHCDMSRSVDMPDYSQAKPSQSAAHLGHQDCLHCLEDDASFFLIDKVDELVLSDGDKLESVNRIPTPFLPSSSSGEACKHMNLTPPRVIPWAIIHNIFASATTGPDVEVARGELESHLEPLPGQ
jgi:hypothetical protein